MRVEKFLIAVVAGLLTSCSFFHDTTAVRFHQQQDVGSVHVAVQSVAPFEGYISSLQPQFTLSTEQAIAAAIQQTQTEDSQLFRALLASLNVSGHQLSGSRTKTFNADGTTTPSGSATTTPGDASKVVAPAAAPDNALGDLSLPDSHANLDQSLTFRTAAALLQEVTLLDNYVRDAAIARHSRPYVVRLLVTLLPSARLEPYDAYTTISFFEAVVPEERSRLVCSDVTRIGPNGRPRTDQICTPEATLATASGMSSVDYGKTRDCEGRDVEILPLLVTDNLESSLHSDTSQRIRDMALALQAFSGATSIGGNARARSEDANKTLNRNLNSLFTLARVAPNTVEARLGAAYANDHYVMVPRTYNVTVIALIPTADSDNASTDEIIPCSNLTFTAQTRMRDADRGTLLPSRPVHALTTQLRETAANWRLRYDPKTESALYGLIREAELGDFAAFKLLWEALKKEQPQSWVADNRAARVLWNEMVALSTLTGRSSGKFQVPLNAASFFSDDSHGTLIDDGKITVLQLIGGANLAADRIDATLLVHSATGTTFHLNNTEAAVGLDGRTANIKFPSLYKLLKKGAPAKVFATVRYLSGTRDWQFHSFKHVWWPQHAQLKSDSDDGLSHEMGARFREDPIAYVCTVDEEADKKDGPKAGFSVIVPSRVIRANRDGVGDLAIEFRSDDKDKPQAVHFAIAQGGFIDHTIPNISFTGAERIVQSDSAYVLTLKNLVVGSKITLHAFRLEGKAEVPAPDMDVVVIGR
jgi:hypothetical protein